MGTRSKGSFLAGEPTMTVQEEMWVVDKPRVKYLCSALLSLQGMEITELVPQANNMLQYSLVCSNSLSIQVK